MVASAAGDDPGAGGALPEPIHRDPAVYDLGGVLLIDLEHQGLEGTVGCFLLPGDGADFALVECGPLTTLPRLEAALTALGRDLGDLQEVLVTHIHLDHAGAAGALARRSAVRGGGARVSAHGAGLAHLVDPERLLHSARRVYGDAFEALLGGMEPLPVAQARALRHGDRFELLGRRVEAIATPGHASSHLSFLLDGRDLYTGDAAAIRLPGAAAVRPATAPPEIDLDGWRHSLARLRAAGAERLLLTHFGPVSDPDAHLTRVERATERWAQAVLEGLREGEDGPRLTARLRALGEAELRREGVAPRVLERHAATSSYAMNTAGLARYWRKHHPEALDSETLGSESGGG